MTNPNASQEVENNNREFWMEEIRDELETIEALETLDAALDLWESVQDCEIDYIQIEAEMIVEDAAAYFC